MYVVNWTYKKIGLILENKLLRNFDLPAQSNDAKKEPFLETHLIFHVESEKSDFVKFK